MYLFQILDNWRRTSRWGHRIFTDSLTFSLPRWQDLWTIVIFITYYYSLFIHCDFIWFNYFNYIELSPRQSCYKTSIVYHQLDHRTLFTLSKDNKNNSWSRELFLLRTDILQYKKTIQLRCTFNIFIIIEYKCSTFNKQALKWVLNLVTYDTHINQHIEYTMQIIQ